VRKLCLDRMENSNFHIPVLLDTVIDQLAPKSGENLLDVTFGRGGHTLKILEITAPGGIAFATDADPDAIKFAENNIEQFSNRLKINHARFSQVLALINEGTIEKPDMLLADLGVSSPQIDNADRGFSYLHDGPIDMRFDPDAEFTAFDILRNSSEKELADGFWKYGEERFSRQIARNIKQMLNRRALKTTSDLVKIIESTIKTTSKGKARDFGPPARRVFQALRIMTNNELGELETLIKNIPQILKPGGRAAIISFHSLEDRIVKFGFKDLEKLGVAEILTKKPLTASRKELHENSRAKSAKLRAIKLLQ